MLDHGISKISLIWMAELGVAIMVAIIVAKLMEWRWQKKEVGEKHKRLVAIAWNIAAIAVWVVGVVLAECGGWILDILIMMSVRLEWVLLMLMIISAIGIGLAYIANGKMAESVLILIHTVAMAFLLSLANMLLGVGYFLIAASMLCIMQEKGEAGRRRLR